MLYQLYYPHVPIVTLGDLRLWCPAIKVNILLTASTCAWWDQLIHLTWGREAIPSSAPSKFWWTKCWKNGLFQHPIEKKYWILLSWGFEHPISRASMILHGKSECGYPWAVSHVQRLTQTLAGLIKPLGTQRLACLTLVYQQYIVLQALLITW